VRPDTVRSTDTPNVDYTTPDVWWGEYGSHYEHRTWLDYRWLLADVIRQGQGGRILDLGCGLGFFVECARRWGMDAIGLEASEQALSLCRRQHPEADVRLWRCGEPLPLSDGSVGVALAHEFIDHISPDQNRALFAELQRVLQPGGMLIVRSPSRFNRFDQDKGHITFFSPSEFRRFVEEYGFVVVEQPFSPQPLLGSSRAGQFVVRAYARLTGRHDRIAARIDLVARKPAASSLTPVQRKPLYTGSP
jgi:SAM-dependent methyltransferase